MKRLLPLFVLSLLVLSSETIHAQDQAQLSGEMTVHYIDVGEGDAILIEFPKAAIMIDAGGEDQSDSSARRHLLKYLNAFFTRRRDLNGTIHTIIITHPHIDHTRYLFDVLKSFRVKTLVDGAPKSGSGMSSLRQAKQFVALKKVRYVGVKDRALEKSDARSLFNDLRAADPDVGIRLLSGSRDCDDQNNDSLVVLVGYKEKRFLFTGDATTQSDEECTDEISMLTERYQKSGLLKADVLKVSLHGSVNGTTDEWMKLISPQYSIISAGRSEEPYRFSSPFNAWQIGFPRESAVRIIQGRTFGLREPAKSVITMKAVKVQSEPILMAQAVYCTCWDGDITVTTDGKNIRVSTSR
ncbi:MAG TPA: MBL fold metallo-hydrolase [Pyrinomonadaceae bacterium]|nr:MBL fold metallo-hydrolase [Pyrinomonadaceae bacterium]